MSFRDEREAQRHRVEALEREVESLREDRDRAIDARDQALRELEEAREDAPPSTGALFRAKQKVYAEWQGSWWDATVVEVVSAGTYRIHYDGWSRAWDEVVSSSRLTACTGSPPTPYRGRGTASGGIVVAAVVLLAICAALGWLFRAGPSTGSSGYAASPTYASPTPSGTMPTTPLPAGAAVSVEWNGSWYPAHVIRSNADGSALIHYDAYSSSFDETVPPARMRTR